MVDLIFHQPVGLPANLQILDHFALSALLHRLKTCFSAIGVRLEPEEIESLAARLIQAMTDTLSDSLLVNYLEASRHERFGSLGNFPNLQLPSPCLSLPNSFPNVETPQFLYGDRLRWLSDGQATDWGMVIGRFYSFAPHRCRWHWCYLIWLDPDSPSAAWINADTAWEDDLEPLEAEVL